MEQPVRIPLRDFFKSQEGVGVNFDIKKTENGIPFIGILAAGGKYIMLCLSKRAAERIAEQEITNLKDYRDKLSVVETKNEAGEERLKLSFNGDYQDFD